MKKVLILYGSFFDGKGERLTVGGVQSYIQALCPAICEAGMQPIILQTSDNMFVKEWNGVTVYGIQIEKNKKARKVLINWCYKIGDPNHDIIIYGSDIFAIKSTFRNTISIQHGISWDVPSNNNGIGFIKDTLHRQRLKLAVISKIKYVRRVVCVDYNFINWYRTISMRPVDSMDVIPNFTQIYEGQHEKENGIIKIIFARRFFWYRGTRVFCEALKRLLEEYPNIYATIAGEGPDEDYINKQFCNYNNVIITKFESNDSLSIHSKHDIAVIPTLGSEGTSLSLLEAMSAGCACIATNIGGMTNIIINGYNGLLVNPDVDSIYFGMKKLVDDCLLRNKLSQNAIDTVKNGFSIGIWTQRWKNLLISL